MVKLQSTAPISSFQCLKPIACIKKDISMRSIESSTSTSSSICSDDPSMKRTTSRTKHLVKQPRPNETIGVVHENITDAHVTFSSSLSEVVCEVMSREDFTEEERRELYITTSDMNQIKSDARFVTKFFRVKDKESISVLDSVYTDAICRSTTFETYDDFLRFIKNDDRQLHAVAETLFPWCRKTKISGRGLERYCSQKQRSDRLSFSTECRAAVVRLSKSNSVTDEEISKFYHEYSRGNAIYARLMGHADQITAEQIAKSLSDNNKDSVSVEDESKVVPQKLPSKRPNVTRNRNLEETPIVSVKSLTHENGYSNSNCKQLVLPLDRRQLLALSKQQQSSSAKLLARLSNRSLESM